MKRMEVRCCCTPNKLLGTLPVSDGTEVGKRIKFALMQPRINFNEWHATQRPPAARGLEFEVQRWALAVELPAEMLLNSNLSPEALEKLARPAGGVALKREGVTVETLRLIPGFIEAQS